MRCELLYHSFLGSSRSLFLWDIQNHSPLNCLKTSIIALFHLIIFVESFVGGQ
jgi:hypothetical protein